MEFDYIAFLLILFYSLLFLFELKQFIQIFMIKNKLINYRNGIICTLTLSAAMRITFWIKVMIPSVVDSTVMMLLFYLPVWLNFTGISLLCVFYANTIFEDKYGHWPKYICILLNVIFGLLNITIGSLVESASTNQDQHVVMYDCYIYYAVFIDALIALLVGFLGYYFVYDHHYHSYRHWVLLPRSIETFSVINWLIVFCFFVRSSFVFIFSLPVIKQSASTEIQFNGNHPVTSILMLFFFLITEWVPNTSMLYLLWKSNTKKPKKYQSDQYLGNGGQSPSSSNLAKTFSFNYRLVSIFPDFQSSKNNSSSSSLPSVMSFEKTPLGSHHNSRNLKKAMEEENGYRVSRVSEDEQQRQTLLSENDLIDQGFALRNPSKDDSVIRVYYNNSDSRTNSSVYTPPSTINLQESGIMEERSSNDYGQHATFLSDDEIGYSPPAPYFPPPINSARHYPSQTRPASSLFKNQSSSHPAAGSSAGSRGNNHLTQENVTRSQGLPIQTNKVAFSMNSTSSKENMQHLPPSSSSTNPTPNGNGNPLLSASSLANHYNATKRPSWNKGQAVISSLYLHPSQQNITRVSSSAKIHNGEGENHLETPPTPLSSKHKSFSSTTSAPHLDPSAIFKVVNEEEEFEQYDLNEKYADTIGPRDILQSKQR